MALRWKKVRSYSEDLHPSDSDRVIWVDNGPKSMKVRLMTEGYGAKGITGAYRINSRKPPSIGKPSFTAGCYCDAVKNRLPSESSRHGDFT
jgi:hypothetical protein